MTSGAALVVADGDGWRLHARPGPDLSGLLAGRPVDEVADLMPRLFNLCRMAQGLAARLSADLPVDTADTTPEVIRDHMAHLFVVLPRALGMAPAAPPRPDPAALFGQGGAMPRDAGALRRWLASDLALARLARAVSARAGGLGTVPVLAGPDGLHPGAAENSPAGRQACHPLLQDRPRGPLWRVLGRLCDLEAALRGALPAARRLDCGTAIVQAGRGAYALRLRHAGGVVTGIDRLTPTDHQLAPGGALDHALRTVPADRPDLARLIIALHDPCIPVTVQAVPAPEVQHA